MECALCHKKETGKTACKKGHYVCNDCHIRGMDSIIGLCLAETSKNPIEIIQKLMALPLCHMHGPEHHVMVGSALFTAYKNASGKLDLHKALLEMQSRGKQVPAELAVFGVLAVQESVQVCKRAVPRPAPYLRYDGTRKRNGRENAVGDHRSRVSGNND